MPIEHTHVQKGIGGIATFHAILSPAVFKPRFLHAALAAAAENSRK